MRRIFCLILITLTFTGCIERVYNNVEDTPDIENAGDSEKTAILPDDICPDKYKEGLNIIFPAPKKNFGSNRVINNFKPSIEVLGNEELSEFFDEFILFYNKKGDEDKRILKISIQTFSGLNELFHICNLNEDIRPQAYYLKIYFDVDTKVYIVSDDKEGFYNAAKLLSQMIFKDILIETSIYDYPQVYFRGVAEAFYGKPWGEEDRLDAISYLAMLRFNLYLYSPKSDPYAWAMWRTPYDEKEENKLREIARHARRLGITPCYGIGPGYDIKFSNNKDYAALLYKYRKLISFGFDRCLVLAFDDTQKSLSEEDSKSFSDMAEAQGYLAKRLYDDIKKIKPDILLAFVPNDYTTEWAKRDNYLKKLSDEIGKYYEIAWTGNQVVSPTITKKDIEEIEGIIGKAPILADNYPVSDLMFNGGAAFLGPITGREPTIFENINMYAANPMRYPIASIIPLGTIADMLWSPSNYESERSFKNSIKFIAKKGGEENIYEFATNLRSSLITDEESPELKSSIESFKKEIRDCENKYYEELKLKFFDRFIIMEQILSGAIDERFIIEMKPWIDKLRSYGGAGNLALDLMKKRCRGEEIKKTEIDRLEQTISYLKEDRYRICGDIMNDFLLFILNEIKGD